MVVVPYFHHGTCDVTLLSHNLCPFLIVGEIPIFSKVILMLPGKFSHLFSLAPSISIHFVSVFGWLTLFHNFPIGLPHSFPKLSIFFTIFCNFPPFSHAFPKNSVVPKTVPRTGNTAGGPPGPRRHGGAAGRLAGRSRYRRCTLWPQGAVPWSRRCKVYIYIYIYRCKDIYIYMIYIYMIYKFNIQ